MNFCSDNTTCAAPEIMAALVAANHGQAAPYGEDDITTGLADLYGALFETEVAVFPVGTGTAGNALALSLMTPPYGAIYCHREAHIEVDECGAPELFTGGATLVVLDGDDRKFPPGPRGGRPAKARGGGLRQRYARARAVPSGAGWPSRRGIARARLGSPSWRRRRAASTGHTAAMRAQSMSMTEVSILPLGERLRKPCSPISVSNSSAGSAR